jgi:kinesin family protein 2/24
MERFYLDNVSKYHSLIDALDPFRKPRLSKGLPGHSMVVSARIRPLSKNEGFPSATFPRSREKNVLDIHDLYNHPSGIPVLRV